MAHLSIEEIENRYQQAAQFVKSQMGDFVPQLGLILGSGLGKLADEIQPKAVISYKDIPHFPQSTVAGHEGKLVIGTMGNVAVVAMQGRVHFYEGYSPWQLAFPVRLLARLGIEALFVSNAAGAVVGELSPGDIMLITDHINAQPSNSLLGAHNELWGPRFVDLGHVWNRELSQKLRQAAQKSQIELHEGVYYANGGPCYETAAEVRMIAKLGGHVAGMSTVTEVMVAAQLGIPVCGLSLVTNMGAGLTDHVNHEEVMEVAANRSSDLKNMVKTFVNLLQDGQA